MLSKKKYCWQLLKKEFVHGTVQRGLQYKVKWTFKLQCIRVHFLAKMRDVGLFSECENSFVVCFTFFVVMIMQDH